MFYRIIRNDKFLIVRILRKERTINLNKEKKMSKNDIVKEIQDVKDIITYNKKQIDKNARMIDIINDGVVKNMKMIDKCELSSSAFFIEQRQALDRKRYKFANENEELTKTMDSCVKENRLLTKDNVALQVLVIQLENLIKASDSIQEDSKTISDHEKSV